MANGKNGSATTIVIHDEARSAYLTSLKIGGRAAIEVELVRCSTAEAAARKL